MEGGAIAVGGALTINNSSFYYNHATHGMWSGGSGGAVFIIGSTAEINNSTFAYNSSDVTGGAVFSGWSQYSELGSNVTFANSTFYGNSSTSQGGAITNGDKNHGPEAVMTVSNTTIAGNGSGSGGGIYNFGVLTFQNSLIANNKANESCINDGGTLADIGGSLRWPKTDKSCPGTDGNPLLAPLGNYGGPTQTLALLPGSAAIDKGDDSTCLNTDQRGIPRPEINHCDSGAFESRGFLAFALDGGGQYARTNTTFPNPLRVGVFSRYAEPVGGGFITLRGPVRGAGISPQRKTIAIHNAIAVRKVSANSFSGSYKVTADAPGIEIPIWFQLTNLP